MDDQLWWHLCHKRMGKFDLEGGKKHLWRDWEETKTRWKKGTWIELWRNIKDLGEKASKLNRFKSDVHKNLDGVRDRTRSNAGPHRRSHWLSPLIAGGLHASQSNSFITSWRKKTNRDLGQRPFEPATSVCPGGAVLQSPPKPALFPWQKLEGGGGLIAWLANLICSGLFFLRSRFPLLLLSFFFLL